MSFSVTGGTPTQAVPDDAYAFEVTGDVNQIRASATVVLTGLPAGSQLIFRAKYKAEGSGTATFTSRDLTVVPLPGAVVTSG